MSKSEAAVSKSTSRKTQKVVLASILLAFAIASVYVALNLVEGIIPDEPAHFIFSKVYATTWGIPADSPETYSQGWYIAHNPFLYHWINGRVINLITLFNPLASDRQLLVGLRLTSVLYSLGTLYFCYLLAKELICKPWWPLLPVFLLANTLMFTFLSGGVNYDNMVNLLCMAGLYFLIRAFNGKDFTTNSLAWLVCVCIGCLAKYTVLPLALFSFIAWLVYTIRQHKTIFPLPKLAKGQIALLCVLILLVVGNLAIYGYNLVVYRAILPSCPDLLQPAQCNLSPYHARWETYSLGRKMTVSESIQAGYPDPLTYFVEVWVKNMLTKTYGILGHKTYYPAHIITFYRLFYLGMLLLAARYWRRPPYAIWSAVFIILGYALVVFITNYNSELSYGFKHFALQGRYLFPIIGLVYGLVGYTQSLIKNRTLRIVVLVLTLILFFVGGPIKFITRYEGVFFTWFLPR
jgi:hypothetical protein